MFFRIFVLNRVSILSLFVFIRVSILSVFVLNRVSFCAYVLWTKLQEIGFWFRVKCLKQGIKNWSSVLNRVRVWGPGCTSPPKDISSTPTPLGLRATNQVYGSLCNLARKGQLLSCATGSRKGWDSLSFLSFFRKQKPKKGYSVLSVNMCWILPLYL